MITTKKPHIKSSFKKNAVLHTEFGYYQHFGIHPKLASVYGVKPEDIVEVELKISNDQSIPPHDKSMNVDYWGWWDNDRKDFTMIYQKHFLLEMCFPYGIKACENKGEGKAYRLEII